MKRPRNRTAWLSLAREGWLFLLPPLLAGLLFLALGWGLMGLAALGAAAFIAHFFRDPERAIPQAARCVVSPADGRVVEIRTADDGCPELGGATQVVSIFLSLWDVHVNRAPCAGRAQRVEYTPGRFLAAFRAEASQANERNTIVVDAAGTPIAVTQIAGVLARRIVCWVHPGDNLERGQRIGLIRFGSRTEVTLPASATLLVEEGAKVKGGSTILARLAPEGEARAT
ncbi:phosphatidylserine decarboxylase family protein [Nitrospinae bacterium AH_259_B05_G02_I21]|nr:phosphatidylserine decarboxylase family protein [Nitrospinae bacterium AH_259_B05_G02_I21]